MAATNIRSITIAGFTIQAGLGVPEHTAPLGTTYTDLSTGYIYKYDPNEISGWRNYLELIMHFLGFAKVDFTTIMVPYSSAFFIGADLDGKLKMKNPYGYIFEVLYN